MGNSGFAPFHSSGQDGKDGSPVREWVSQHEREHPFASSPLHHAHSILHSVHIRFPNMISVWFLTAHLMGYILWQLHLGEMQSLDA